MILVLQVKRNVDFNLILHAESLFVNDMTDHSGSALRIECRRDDDFIFGIGFFCDKSPGKIQFAARPARLTAESAHVANHAIDLSGGEGFRKRRHDLRKTAIRAAIGDDCLPCRIWFRGSLIALRKIGKRARWVEGADGFGSAFAIGPVASHAGSLVDLLSGVQAQGGRAPDLPEENVSGESDQ